MPDPEHKWNPLNPSVVSDLRTGLSVPWWISGGWAIDLFVGRQTRPHGDIDVLILRPDQLSVQAHLSDWDLHKTGQPGLKPWPMGEFLDPPINDIWGKRKPEDDWAIQLMLMEVEGEEWVFRRAPGIGGPISRMGKVSDEGIPYLCPEIQLLYKADRLNIERNVADFQTAAPELDTAAKDWLVEALKLKYTTHNWIDTLTA